MARTLGLWFAGLAILVALGASAFLAIGGEPARAEPPRSLHAGDIVFQTSSSPQSDAIQRATHSPVTHVGLLVHAGKSLVVYEAEATVRTTPLDAWVARAPRTFVVKRLKDAARLFTPESTARLVAIGRRHMKKPYDTAFGWSDDKMYCSELVWKIYHEALGVDLGTPKPLRSFDLTSPEVRAALGQRYGKAIPLDEPMIAPQQIFDSDLLETVRDDRP